MNARAPAKTSVLVIPEEGKAWVVIHTRPRCEKRVVEYCERQDIPVYLPLRQKVHRYEGRHRAFWSPLFPGYTFCVTDDPQRSALRQNRYVANVLTVLEQEKLLHQLQQIQRALDVGNVVEVMPYLEAGKPIRVTGGPFKGLEGLVVRIKGNARVVINVDMIQQSVAVEVESSLLVPA